MKRFLMAAATIGTLTIAGAAQAGGPHGNPHFAHYRYDHVDRGCYREPVVRYYAPPVVYSSPVIVARPTCSAPLVYDSYYQPAGTIALYGRNFGVQFNW
jgi:hypothetical protein